ncbi:MAG: ATP-dependent DNA ligase, partial [Salinarimonas sp.]
MKRFSALLDRLVYEPRRNAKIRLIADYLRTTPDPERGWALAALTGGLTFREAKAGLVRGLIQERTDPVLFEMSYSYVGDLAETVALLWPQTSLPGGEGGPWSAATGVGWGPGGDPSANLGPHPTSVADAPEATRPAGGGVGRATHPVGEGARSGRGRG